MDGLAIVQLYDKSRVILLELTERGVARDRLELSLAQLFALLAEPEALKLIRSRPCLDEGDLSRLQRTGLEVCA